MIADMHIRDATIADAAALLAIYRPYVVEAAVSFEMSPPSEEEFSARIAKASSRWSWLVAIANGECIGYAYGSAHRERAAYRYSVETSAYVHPTFHRQGVARALYVRLLAVLAERGYCNAFAGVAIPNDASLALHRSLGFTPIGTFRSVGRKFDAWHDVSWWQYELRRAPRADGTLPPM